MMNIRRLVEQALNILAEQLLAEGTSKYNYLCKTFLFEWGLKMRNFTQNQFPIKYLLINSLLTPIVEITYIVSLLFTKTFTWCFLVSTFLWDIVYESASTKTVCSITALNNLDGRFLKRVDLHVLKGDSCITTSNIFLVKLLKFNWQAVHSFSTVLICNRLIWH